MMSLEEISGSLLFLTAGTCLHGITTIRKTFFLVFCASEYYVVIPVADVASDSWFASAGSIMQENLIVEKLLLSMEEFHINLVGMRYLNAPFLAVKCGNT